MLWLISFFVVNETVPFLVDDWTFTAIVFKVFFVWINPTNFFKMINEICFFFMKFLNTCFWLNHRSFFWFRFFIFFWYYTHSRNSFGFNLFKFFLIGSIYLHFFEILSKFWIVIKRMIYLSIKTLQQLWQITSWYILMPPLKERQLMSNLTLF